MQPSSESFHFFHLYRTIPDSPFLSDPFTMWDYVFPGVSHSVDEQALALAAAYLALNRYIHGQDLYIVPTTRDELEQAL